MEFKLTWNDKIDRMQQPYLKQLLLKRNLFIGDNRKMFDLMMHKARYMFSHSENEPYDCEAVLVELCRRDKWTSATELYDRYKSVFNILLGRNYALLYRSYLENIAAYPYQQGAYRRSQRSAAAFRHMGMAINAFNELLYVRALGFSDDELLRKLRTSGFIREELNTTWYAAHLLQSDEKVADIIREAICSDNNHVLVSYDMLRAIVQSGRSDLIQLEGQLLLAARLQEGLRQAVVETMDCGTAEAHLQLFRLIMEHDLIRYSAVYRGVLTWCGIGTENIETQRIPKKLAARMLALLTNREERLQALQSSDRMEQFTAIWSMGFYEFNDIAAYTERLLDEKPEDENRLILALYAYSICFYHYDRFFPIIKKTVRLYARRLDILAPCLNYYLGGISLYGNAKDLRHRFDNLSYRPFFFNDETEASEQFRYLEELLKGMRKDVTFQPFIFPWIQLTVTRADISAILTKIALMVKTPYMKTQVMHNYLSLLPAYKHIDLLDALDAGRETDEWRECLFECVCSRSENIRGEAIARINRLIALSDDEIIELEKMLRLKYPDMRAGIIGLLINKQIPKNIIATIRRLLQNEDEEVRLAALDMMVQLHKDDPQHPVLKDCLPFASETLQPTVREQVLLNQIRPEPNIPTISYTPENGFGLFRGDAPDIRFPLNTNNPVAPVEFLPMLKPKGGLIKTVLNVISGKAVYCEALGLLQQMEKLVRSLWGRTYYGANKQEYIYGEEDTHYYTYQQAAQEGIDTCPFAEEWRAFYREHIQTDTTLFQLKLIVRTACQYGGERNFKYTIFKSIPLVEIANEWKKTNKQIFTRVNRVIESFRLDNTDARLIECAVSFVRMLTGKITESCQYTKVEEFGDTIYANHLVEQDNIDCWFRYLRNAMAHADDTHFARIYAALYAFYAKCRFMRPQTIKGKKIFFKAWHHVLPIQFSCRAFEIGLISHDELVRELTVRPLAETNLKATQDDKNTRCFSPYPKARQAIQTVEHRILDIELNRGDSPTAVSKLAVCLRHIYGGENLMRLLAAFGKNSFTVGRVDASDGKNKKDVFSKLLFYSMPSPDDTPDSLRRWQQQYHIKDVRLVEVALYAPKWATIIEQTIGWDGLTCADYYFRAHTCTECAEQEKAIIARYSPLAVDDLQNGAFDVEWFREAYHKLGKERFNTVYAAAKYVSNGQSHTRARRYADAALGKVNASDLQQEIIGKRNKDLLMSYTIIPLRNEDDLMERYLYIRQFQKESRSFGAQRQASERLASETALLNLSVNAGYESADLMMWTLETRLVEQMRHYFDYHEIDGINLRLYINEKGMPEWDIKKNGKTLKSIPAALKKNSLIIEMKEAQRKLKEQVARARMLFEKAMNEGLLFNRSDVEGLMKNPILLPILQTLVWTTASGHATGFYANGGLQAADHTITPLATHDKLRIAHPTDLYQSGSWHLYQKQLFNHSIVQPFKQVFRELYLPTVDEQPMYETRRYAGQQIQPRRTKALLTKHGWVTDYENGMQRIYYKENIVATLYSEADWFSPSEVECPAIEYVSFTERRSDKPIPIEKMPARIFSEIMRDVDLVVSVAHVGGVDPESSHSTMEMRRCVLECVLPLFKLHNVHFKGNFVEVEGRLGIYHIHLGSTIVHQTTGNAINIQPVYSGQRGRIFLPFLDEDPQTATLVSKVLLLAEDHKIKDPFILQQIVTNKN